MYLRPSDTSKHSTCSKECQRVSRKDVLNADWRGGQAATRKNLRRKAMSQLEYKDWRRAVFARDDYTCQMCHKRGMELQADHIKPWAYYKELRYEVSNGRTLCIPCHITTYKDLPRHLEESQCV